MKKNKFLEKVKSPKDLKKIPIKKLSQFCQELREEIIDQVLTNGGHFASSLGVVELTTALHYVFETPKDNIVWDVGHQAYGHKMITGRKDKFHTNRKYKGLSGFTKREESEHDCFVSGHSSISISAALGMSVANAMQNKKNQNIAVIGDGALTGGVAFEGLNNTGHLDADMLIILNDNQISIDPNIGALKNYLLKISSSQSYNSFKQNLKKALRKVSTEKINVEDFAQKIEKSLKNVLLNTGNNFFESLNIRYFGPVDGHDVEKLVETLENLKKIKGPKLLHVLTTKGKGYEEAEKNQTKWHATNGNDYKLESNEKTEKTYKYQEVFGHTITELAKENKDIVAVTPAMVSGSSLNIMQKKYPKRVFDVGIAEQHAVTFSAGLATQGLRPFCHLYSTFAQRAYDQIIHDVAIQSLPIVFCFDRAGVVGEDGETHHGVFDLAYLKPIPNLIIASPMNELDLKNLMYTAYKQTKHPFFIRYPRGEGSGISWKDEKFSKLPIGKGVQITKGKDKLAILTLGPAGNHAQEAITELNKKGVYPSHHDLRFLKPLDTDLLHEIMKENQIIVTVEDGVVNGGFGSSISDFITENGYPVRLKKLGIPDKFVKHGKIEQLQAECGYDSQSIIEEVEKLTIKKS